MCAYTEESKSESSSQHVEIRRSFYAKKWGNRNQRREQHHPSRVLSNHYDVFVHNPFRYLASGNFKSKFASPAESQTLLFRPMRHRRYPASLSPSSSSRRGRDLVVQGLDLKDAHKLRVRRGCCERHFACTGIYFYRCFRTKSDDQIGSVTGCGANKFFPFLFFCPFLFFDI